jgi:hypothetical protein
MTAAMCIHAAVMSLAIGLSASATGAQSPQTAGAPPACQVSTDPKFAFTPEQAVRVGGGAMYVAARERRYIESLRGPAGQTLTARRLGQARAPGKEGILDNWELNYEGLEKPVSIYLDAYHFADPKAPAGLTCVAFTLGPPPVDAFLGMDLLIRLAVEQGAARDFPPIPLDPNGAMTYGVAFDRFRLVARAARAATVAGTPLTVETAAKVRASLTVVAYPLMCGSRSVAPVNVEVVPRQGPPVPRPTGPVSGTELAALLPGATLPEGAIGAVFNLMTFRPVDAVRISYAGEVCDGTTREALLPTAHSPARGVTMPEPAKPSDIAGPLDPIWLQAVVDLDGLLQQASYIGGPESFLDVALATLRQWRAEPARINGAPVTADTLALLRFR